MEVVEDHPPLQVIRDHIGSGGKKVKQVWAACEDCGRYRWVRLVKNLPRNKLCNHCSAIRKGDIPKPWMIGERNHRWKGGKYKNQSGYITTRIYPNDFFYPMAQRNKSNRRQGVVLEHRLVMAKHLNRCLLPWEVVHHINGIKDDNRIENLQLLPTSKFHIVDSELKAYVKRLEKENAELREKLGVGVR